MITPLAYQFQLTYTLKDFINSTLGNIIVFLAILLATLMYSLMLQDTTQKTYEYGMLRALGFKKSYLVGVISLKSLSFSVLGLFLGIVIAIIMNVFLREVIYIEALNYLTYDLTTVSIVIGVLFGFLTPLFANYWPVKQSMSKNLRDSLDLSRSLGADSFGISI